MPFKKVAPFQDKAWMKKDSTRLFDVTMGNYDGVEVCELVGIFALAHITRQFKKGDVGLYRDNGLAVLRGMSGSAAERTKKDVTKCFNDLGLHITIQPNLKIVDFLDLTFNLNNGKYYPYQKPNNKPLYINQSSNHPPSILNQLPAAISRRLTDISYDAEVFKEAVPLYNDALKASGFTESIEYISSRKKQRIRSKRNRLRKITWFNPPYSKNIKTRIGQKFLRLINKHFPEDSKLHKIFNWSTVKISYSCMPNIGTIIKRHNARVCGAGHADNQTRRCNCRKPDQCPLNGECLASSIVYKAIVRSDDATTNKVYIGSTETPFKQRFANHTMSFRRGKVHKQYGTTKIHLAAKTRQ